MKKTTNFDAFAQFADAQLSKEEMKNIKGGAEWESGDLGTGGGGEAPNAEGSCYDIKGGRRVRTYSNAAGTRWFTDSSAGVTEIMPGNTQYIQCTH